MFNLADYLEVILPTIPEAKKVYKASDITKIEEMLQDIRNTPDCLIISRETGDGHLNLRDRALDTGYHNFFVLQRAQTANSDSRHEAKKKAMNVALKIFRKMRSDAMDFGDPCYGVDFSKIDYMGHGPIGADYHGYSFFILVEQGI
jgi:hypothetical protein